MYATFFGNHQRRAYANMEKSAAREVQVEPLHEPPPPYTAQPTDLPRFSELSLDHQPEQPAVTTQSDQSAIDSRINQQVNSTQRDEQTFDRNNYSLLPCAIPQTSKAFRGAFYSPFIRAYPPDLADTGISKEDFLTFIDGLNESFVASPAFQVTNIAGMIMQQVYGVQPVQLAGIGLSVASGATSAATSYMRTRAYVKAINKDLFHPAGLTATVLKTKKMAAKVGYPNEKLELLPIDWENESMDDLPSRSKKDEQDDSNTAVLQNVAQRRLDPLSGYVAPLDFNVPPSVPSTSLLKRMGENQAKRMQRRQQKRMNKQRRKGNKEYAKGLRKVDKERRKMEDDIMKLHRELEKQESKEQKELGKEKALEDPKERQKIEEEFDREKRKIEKEVAKVEAEYAQKEQKELNDGGKKRARADKKESKAANKVYWIVITKWDENGEESDSEELVEEDGKSETSHQSPPSPVQGRS